jgi:hypothetical protein
MKLRAAPKAAGLTLTCSSGRISAPVAPKSVPFDRTVAPALAQALGVRLSEVATSWASEWNCEVPAANAAVSMHPRRRVWSSRRLRRARRPPGAETTPTVILPLRLALVASRKPFAPDSHSEKQYQEID